MKLSVIATAIVACTAVVVAGPFERDGSDQDRLALEMDAPPAPEGPSTEAGAIAAAVALPDAPARVGIAGATPGAGAEPHAAHAADAHAAAADAVASTMAAWPTSGSHATTTTTTARTRPTTSTTLEPTESKRTIPPPSDPRDHVFTEDTVFTSTFKLRPGDTVTLRNGACLCFGEGGRADWRGTPTFTWSDDGTKQNLRRDINIRGDGHIKFGAGSGQSTIRFVRIDLDSSPELGKYALHWHHAGDGSRGTIVEGTVVSNESNRGYVPHASHGITFRDTIAKDVRDSAYWWDGPPSFQSKDSSNYSNDILYDHALADGVIPYADRSGRHRISGFKLGGGTGNTVRDSVAMNVDGGKDAAGFQWPEEATTVWGFFDNVAHDNGQNGIFVWQNDNDPHEIHGFTGYDNGTADIDHGAYANRYEYFDIDVDQVEVHATGWDVTGGRIGVLVTRRHRLDGGPNTFTDVKVGRLVISNECECPRLPGHYEFVRTGLTWANVSVLNVVPGTTVTINGEKRTY